MKKLVIAAMIACAAAFAQAAAVSWGSGTLYNASGAKVKATVTAYVYLLADADAYNALDNIWAAYGADVLKGGTTADATGQSGSLTSRIGLSTDSVANETYYAAIIATYGTGSDMKYYAEKASVTTGDDGNGSYSFGVGKIASQTAAANAWQAVPEPTSGLLMLVGCALLALKRKRA